MGNVTITIEDPVRAIVIFLVSGVVTYLAISAVAKAVGWIADGYIKDFERERDKLYERMVRYRDELIALLKESGKRNGENFQAINAQIEKLDRKIDLTRKELNKKGEKRHGETRDGL